MMLRCITVFQVDWEASVLVEDRRSPSSGELWVSNNSSRHSSIQDLTSDTLLALHETATYYTTTPHPPPFNLVYSSTPSFYSWAFFSSPWLLRVSPPPPPD